MGEGFRMEVGIFGAGRWGDRGSPSGSWVSGSGHGMVDWVGRGSSLHEC